MHAAGLAGLFVWRRTWHEDARVLLDWLAAWGRLFRDGTLEGRFAAGLILLVVFLAVLAAQVEPIVFDALAYRLPRIGAWLQDGWIQHYEIDDPRLNYMPVAPDVVIAWLLGATNNGFFLAPLAQTAGGALLLGATFGLARIVGLARLNALGAVALALGMANVAVQFTTIQSDLFTRNGSDAPRLASAWSECRSLLAGDAARPLTDHLLNRLQASSYKGEQIWRAS